ncbi:serine/threonine-protein kinase [Kitasatospora camelliae]|uniref:Serine/threonine-protein kinase n=1 Tax=Kitasatospora camelliae TaxID=3156397 RepID=A0AAU8K6Y0_9ACTN
MEDERSANKQAGQTPEDARWQLPDYTHGRELGAGAAGRVVLASHDATGTPVAIKYLNGESADHSSFRSEAELLGGLSSPHVTRLYEYVESPLGAAIVMELVDGVSLRELLQAEGATSPEAALTVLKGSLLGLAAAHEAGVVHRDYKPGNVLVTTDGTSKLVDFGIAVRSGDTGDLAGTPAYMAPEQWTGEPASPASDVYAATATFFECLTGAKPYAGTTLVELALQHTEAAIPDEEAPEALRPLIRSGLAKDPGSRPRGAAALVVELEAVAGAAYGPQWEERGRRKLAALVALVPFLLPLGAGGGHAVGATSLATTHLPGAESGTGQGGGWNDGSGGSGGSGGSPSGGDRVVRAARFGRRAKLISAGAGVALLGGALAGVAAAGGSTTDGGTQVATPELTTTFSIGGPTLTATPIADPSPSASGSPSASASASPSASPSATSSLTAKPSPSPTKPGATPTATATLTPTVAPPTTVTPPPPPTLHVYSVGIADARCWGSTGMDVQVTVTSDGAAAGTLTFAWLSSAKPFNSSRPSVVYETVTVPKGQTKVSIRRQHAFTSTYYGVRVSTTPAADRGQNDHRELDYYTCNPIR